MARTYSTTIQCLRCLATEETKDSYKINFAMNGYYVCLVCQGKEAKADGYGHSRTVRATRPA